jgi:hypothetical protein
LNVHININTGISKNTVTQHAYEKLHAVISSFTPIVESIPSNAHRNIPSFTRGGGSVVLDANDDGVRFPPLLSQATPTTN